MTTKELLVGTDLLCVVPAGGEGTRLGPLTKEYAKPALAVGFDDEGNIKRMIDIPLEAIRLIGGAAIVTTRYAAETLEFVDLYPYAQTRKETDSGSPIDSLIGELEVLESSQATVVGIVPGDARVTAEMLESMNNSLNSSMATAAILATRFLKGHNVRPIDKRGMMTRSADASDYVADLGVHIMRKEWLVDELKRRVSKGLRGDVWDLYCVEDPVTDVLLHIPEQDPIVIDMGTGAALHSLLLNLNSSHIDGHGNVLFPGADATSNTYDTIALPASTIKIPLSRAIVPENIIVQSKEDAYVLLQPDRWAHNSN